MIDVRGPTQRMPTIESLKLPPMQVSPTKIKPMTPRESEFHLEKYLDLPKISWKDLPWNTLVDSELSFLIL